MISILRLIGVLALLAVPALADPAEWRSEGWTRTDFSRTTIVLADILSGGPPKDGIPAIDLPKFVSVADATEMQDTDPVISIDINGDSRAYPLKILIWHEIANDTVGGVPVTITYCPLCNASVVFDRRVDDRVLDFGTTGKLRNSDLIMYDRQTETWWQQFTGEGIVGEQAGKMLKMLPARIEAFSEFSSRQPLGKVLVPTDPAMRDYGRNPYLGYDTSSSPFLYRGDMPEGVDPMARVVLIRPEGASSVIVTLDLVRRRGVLEYGGYRLIWKPGQSSAVDTSEISRGQDVGTVIATEISSGKLVTYDVVFAFAAHAFLPATPIIGK